jgi:hypothetical protein
MNNKHLGSTLQSFFEELGEWEEIKARAEEQIKKMEKKPTIKEMLAAPPLQCPICERPNYHPSDHHMVPRSRGGKTTETICQDCHKAIHAVFTNKELESTYHTVDALMGNEEFAKMAKFISKQDPAGKVTTRKSKRRQDKMKRE